jgi:hypothetical protein
MVTAIITIKNKKRLVELQNFMKENIQTARFKGNPQELSQEKYLVTLTYDGLVDGNKLAELRNKWFEADKPAKYKRTRKFKTF